MIEKTDRRSKPARSHNAVECDAVGQVALERMLRGYLDRLLPEPLDAVLVRQAAERAALIKFLRGRPKGRDLERTQLDRGRGSAGDRDWLTGIGSPSKADLPGSE